MKRIFKSALLLLLVGMAAASCSNEISIEPGPGGGGDKIAMVDFDIELPAAKKVVTKGVQTLTEAAVNDIYVLIFKKDGTYVDCKIIGSGSITTSGTTAKETKTFKVALPLSASAAEANKYDLVMLANVADGESGGYKTQVDAQIAAKAAKTTFLAALNHYSANNVSMPVPMASVDKGAITITASTDFKGANGFKLIRMVARVDVGFGTAVTGHTITEVLMYNHNKRGKVWTGAETATAPTLPATPGKVNDSKFTVLNTASDKSTFKELMYAFEANVMSTDAKKPCLVVRLSDGAKDLGYYRVDFKTAGGTWLNILRNHRYIFTISKIHGGGFTDPDVAYNSTVVGLDTDVIDWNDTEMGDIIVQGSYWLSVSKKEFNLWREELTAASDNNVVTISTNCLSTGWEVVKITDDEAGNVINDGWLTTDRTTGPGDGTKNNMVIRVSENNSGTDRIGYIHLKAGSIETYLKVTQSIESRLKLTVTDLMNREVNTLTFDPTTPIAQQFKVNFEPKSANLNILVTKAGMDFFEYGVDDAIADGSYSGLNGVKNYKILPPSYNIVANPLVERISKVEFMVSNGTEMATKTIYLKQMNYATISDEKSLYSLNNTITNNLTIKSNSSWVVKSVTGNEEVLSGLTFAQIKTWTGGNIDGDTFNFKFVDDLDGIHNAKSVTIVLTDPDGKAADHTIVLNVVPCGLEGVANNRKIGNGTYLTHMYAGKCWMVQNSIEGTYSSRYYNNDPAYDLGAYYSYEQRGNACPAGWQVPSKQNGLDMASDVTAKPVPIGEWWLKTTYFGGYNDPFLAPYPEQGPVWGRWNVVGNWWTSEIGVIGTMPYITASVGSIIIANTDVYNEWRWNVRCIETPTYFVAKDVKDYYAMDGTTSQSFTVQATGAWKVKSVTDPSSILIAGSYPATGAATTGAPFSFKLATKSGSTAVYSLTIVFESATPGSFPDYPVTITASPCGVNGVALPLTIGTNGYTNNPGATGTATYLTYGYGTGSDYRCWMVQNSREGVSTDKAYGINGPIGSGPGPFPEGANGYYYSWNESVNACPTGWRLADNNEFTKLIAIVNANKTGIGKWWLSPDENACAGSKYNTGQWNLWGIGGFWWTSNNSSNTGAYVTAGTMYGPYPSYLNFKLTVRCVRN